MFFLKSQELFPFLRQSTRADVTPQISGGVKHAVPLPSDIRVISDFKLRVSLLNDSLSGSFIFFFFPSPRSRCISFLSLQSRCPDSHSRRRCRLVAPNNAPLCPPPPPPSACLLPPRLLSPSHSFCLLLCFTFISVREKSETERLFVFSPSLNRLNSLAPRMLNATRGAKRQLYGSIKASHLLGDFFLR